MPNNFYGDPLTIARIFLSHAWEDIGKTDVLYHRVRAYFPQVYYDQKDMAAGDSTVPKEEIAGSDIFLFAASPNSTTDKTRKVYRELIFAQKLYRTRFSPVIVVVLLEDFPITKNLSDPKYIRFWSDDVVKELKKTVFKSGGLYKMDTRDDLIYGGENTEHIREILISNPMRGLYMMNAIFPYWEMNKFARDIIKLSSPGDKEKILDKLVTIFISEHKHSKASIARQNIITLISKIAEGRKDLINELKGRGADYSFPFLYRGEQLALGRLGDTFSSIDYAMHISE